MHSLTHTKALSNFIFLKHFRPAYAGIRISKERSPDTIRTPFFSFCRFAPALSRFALRHLVQRLVRCHALRLHDFTAEGQTRADIRTRTRGIVTRIRIRDTANRVRMADPR